MLKNGETNKGNYGFGWVIVQRNGHRCITHDGSWQGFETAIARYVDDQLTVVALDNMAELRPRKDRSPRGRTVSAGKVSMA